MSRGRPELVNPPTVAAPIGSYSHAAVVPPGTRLIFISGQGPIDERGELVGPGDLIAQAAQVFENIRRILAHWHADHRNVLKMNLYLTDLSRRSELGQLRARLYGDHAPASTAVQVSRLAVPEWMIEIECVAEVPE